MPPIGLPARDMLKLPGQTDLAWAVFDAAWYRAAHPDVPGDDAALLQHYLDEGQQRGASPNPWFDEAWHLRTYPGVAAMVREGQARSGFDTYCRQGFRMRSPHWLFDERLYRQRYPDLNDEALARDALINGYDHFLKQGSRERRIGQPLFDPAIYRRQLDTDEREAADTAGPYLHYLRRLAQRPAERRTSVYFDPLWYRERYPVVAEGIATGRWLCALHHYLDNDSPTAFDPLPEFSEAYYLERNQDVATAVQAGNWRNGYGHFLRHGAGEQRPPCATIDLRHYVSAHPDVRDDLARGRARDAFTHYLLLGRDLGLAALPARLAPVSEGQAASLNRWRAEALLPIRGRHRLDFSYPTTPDVSVIMLLRDSFPLTLMALVALRGGYSGSIELILLDGGSTDDTRRIGRFVQGAHILRFDTALDFTRAANAAVACATADAILFLDSAVEPMPGALAQSLHRLRSDAHIGAVGGKLVRADGWLDSAGAMVRRDGSLRPYLSGASPLAPEANFVRDVDYCCADFLLVRAGVLKVLDGFDETLAGSQAAADLGLRIGAAGHRVVYDPAVVVQRLTEHEAGPPTRNEALLSRHAARLRSFYPPDGRNEVFARSTGTVRRVLFIDDMIPLRRFGSGFVRSNDLIQVMASLGYQVTVFPIERCRVGPATVYADMPDTVEVMHDRAAPALGEFLAARAGYYDVIWIARTHNLDRVQPVLAQTAAAGHRLPRIVLDTEAIVALREAEQAALDGGTGFDVDAALLREFAGARHCRHIVAVSAQEAQTLRRLGFADVSVIGHWCEPRPTARGFDQRAGILFFGAIHDKASPNLDALDWFVREVMPLVEQALGWETRLAVAGYVDPSVSLQAYRDHPRITLHGPVEDIAALYDTHRLVVAPTRFAAGVPYKVHEAASFGVPVVATELLRQQIGWQDGHDIIAVDAADTQGFARQVIALYRDPVLWQRLRDNALARVQAENDGAQFAATVRRVLES